MSETGELIISSPVPGDCDKGDLFQAVTDALHQVEGTFGIAVLSAREPDRIITARRGSPIVIGVGATDCPSSFTIEPAGVDTTATIRY